MYELWDPQLIVSIYTACFGGTVCIVIQYIMLAFLTFEKRTSLIFKLVIGGLSLCFVEAVLIMIFMHLSTSYMLFGLGIVSFIRMQLVAWLYVLRIKSLGSYISWERGVKYIPYIIAAAQMPMLVIAFLSKNPIDYMVNYRYFWISASVSQVTACLVEIFMNTLLLKKLNFALEYKPAALKKIVTHLYLASLIVTVLELSLQIIRAYIPIDLALNPIIYAIRIYIIIQFYDNLLLAINTDEAIVSERLKSYELSK